LSDECAMRLGDRSNWLFGEHLFREWHSVQKIVSLLEDSRNEPIKHFRMGSTFAVPEFDLHSFEAPDHACYPRMAKAGFSLLRYRGRGEDKIGIDQNDRLNLFDFGVEGARLGVDYHHLKGTEHLWCDDAKTTLVLVGADHIHDHLFHRVTANCVFRNGPCQLPEDGILSEDADFNASRLIVIRFHYWLYFYGFSEWKLLRSFGKYNNTKCVICKGGTNRAFLRI
jgi:hypothetical protein